jgi:3-phosphoshikimate 1-carboxyvinyltransferase
MKYTIKPISSPVNTTIQIPGSKSITNRALLLAALARGRSKLSGMLFSDDTLTFIKALKALGVTLLTDTDQHTCIVEGVNGRFLNNNADIWCQDAGTAIRFLLSACASTPGQFHFDGSARLRQRPLSALLNILTAQGAQLYPENTDNMPFTIIGSNGLSGGKIYVPGEESSQFLSSLLMVAPFAKSNVILHASKLVSRPYIALTCAMMQEFGVMVEQKSDDTYCITVPQQYHSQQYNIEPDLSTASYFFAAAAVSKGKITVTNLDRQACKQGDIKFLNVLEKMGCRVENLDNSVSVYGPQKLFGIDVDMCDISDTFITLACIAPFADKPTVITNIGHTRFQESNRIEAVAANLSKLGVLVEHGDDYIKIYPSHPQPGLINSYNDHRIAMGFSLIGLIVPEITIDNIECAAKTCPDFTTLWEMLL